MVNILKDAEAHLRHVKLVESQYVKWHLIINLELRREDWARAIIWKLSKTIFWCMSMFKGGIMEGKTSIRH